MRIINEELFPLAKFLVIGQMKKFGVTLENLIIMNEPDKPVAGFYQDEDKTICLNVAVLENYFSRYKIASPPWENADKALEEQITRCGAAVLFEECYHAGHHGTETNTDALAVEYATTRAEKLPTEILLSHSRNIPEPKPAVKDGTTKIEITSGGMFDFINQIAKKKEFQQTRHAQFGSVEVSNDRHITTVKHTTDPTLLAKAKNALGNITRVGIEYAGMVYVFEEGGWKIFIDIDDKKMTEMDITKPTEIILTKHENGPLVEATT